MSIRFVSSQPAPEDPVGARILLLPRTPQPPNFPAQPQSSPSSHSSVPVPRFLKPVASCEFPPVRGFWSDYTDASSSPMNSVDSVQHLGMAAVQTAWPFK